MRPFSAKLKDTLMEEIHAYNTVVKKTFDDCFLMKRCPCGPFRVRLFEKDVTFHSHCSWWWHSKSDSHCSKAMFIKRLSQNGHYIYNVHRLGTVSGRMDYKLQSFQKYCFQCLLCGSFKNESLFPFLFFLGRIPVKLCGYSGSHSYFSEGSYLHITFHSDGSDEDTGFSIKVEHFLSYGK